MLMVRYLLAAVLLLAASPAMAWCGNTATNCYRDDPTLENIVKESKRKTEELQRELAEIERRQRTEPAKKPTCLGLLKFLTSFVRLSEPANFGTYVVDKSRVDEMAKRDGEIADRTLAQCTAELGGAR